KVLLVQNDEANFITYGKRGAFNEVLYRFYLKKHNNFLFVLLNMPFILFSSIYLLSKWKVKDKTNILFVYHNIGLEYLIQIVFAKLFGYKIIADLVEDYSTYKGKVSSKFKVKSQSIKMIEKKIFWFVDGVIVISSYLEKKLLKIVNNKIP